MADVTLQSILDTANEALKAANAARDKASNASAANPPATQSTPPANTPAKDSAVMTVLKSPLLYLALAVLAALWFTRK